MSAPGFLKWLERRRMRPRTRIPGWLGSRIEFVFRLPLRPGAGNPRVAPWLLRLDLRFRSEIRTAWLLPVHLRLETLRPQFAVISRQVFAADHRRWISQPAAWHTALHAAAIPLPGSRGRVTRAHAAPVSGTWPATDSRQFFVREIRQALPKPGATPAGALPPPRIAMPPAAIIRAPEHQQTGCRFLAASQPAEFVHIDIRRLHPRVTFLTAQTRAAADIRRLSAPSYLVHNRYLSHTASTVALARHAARTVAFDRRRFITTAARQAMQPHAAILRPASGAKLLDNGLSAVQHHSFSTHEVRMTPQAAAFLPVVHRVLGRSGTVEQNLRELSWTYRKDHELRVSNEPAETRRQRVEQEEVVARVHNRIVEECNRIEERLVTRHAAAAEELTDQVYSRLARRLQTERERLGP